VNHLREIENNEKRVGAVAILFLIVAVLRWIPRAGVMAGALIGHLVGVVVGRLIASLALKEAP